MTLGCGASAVDGIVIATDSLLWTWSHTDGRDASASYARDTKLGWVGDRVAFIRSGAFWDETPCEPGAELFRPTARSIGDILWPQLVQRRVLTPQVNRLDEIELLVGGGPSGSPPELHWYHSEVEQSLRVPTGSLAVVGCMAFENPEPIWHIRANLTTDEALGLVISACRAYVRDLYLEHGRRRLGEFPGACGVGGPVPPVAFPLHVAVITAREVVRYQVNRPGDITSADIERAKASVNDASAVDQDGARDHDEGGPRWMRTAL